MVDRLDRPVQLTYFFQGQDPNGRRAADIMEIMGRRNPLLQVRTVDPDKQPTLAENFGVKLYNAAVLEADGRRITVRSIDESEIAIGIQRVLRERVVTVCFIEGHGEYPIDNFEFHTHFEGVADHSHDKSDAGGRPDHRPRLRSPAPRARRHRLRRAQDHARDRRGDPARMRGHDRRRSAHHLPARRKARRWSAICSRAARCC